MNMKTNPLMLRKLLRRQTDRERERARENTSLLTDLSVHMAPVIALTQQQPPWPSIRLTKPVWSTLTNGYLPPISNWKSRGYRSCTWHIFFKECFSLPLRAQLLLSFVFPIHTTVVFSSAISSFIRSLCCIQQ